MGNVQGIHEHAQLMPKEVGKWLGGVCQPHLRLRAIYGHYLLILPSSFMAVIAADVYSVETVEHHSKSR